jgi:hypothetical protein
MENLGKPYDCKSKPKTLILHQAMASKFSFFHNTLSEMTSAFIWAIFSFFNYVFCTKLKFKQGCKLPKIRHGLW